MTIPSLIVTSLLIGASVAFAARIQIRTLQRPILSARYFLALMIFEFVIMLPIGIYFYSFYPDWSWMYLVDTQNAATGISVMAIVGYPVTAAMGYLVGHYSARSSSDWVTVMFMVFMFVGLFGLFVVGKDQILWVGTYDQYHRDAGIKSLASTSVLPSMILSISGIAVCWAFLVYRFLQEGRLSLKAF